MIDLVMVRGYSFELGPGEPVPPLVRVVARLPKAPPHALRGEAMRHDGPLLARVPALPSWHPYALQEEYVYLELTAAEREQVRALRSEAS